MEYIGFEDGSGAAVNPSPADQINSMNGGEIGPGEVDNSKLLVPEQIGANLSEEQEFLHALAGGSCLLRRDIMEGADYSLLSEKQWDYVVSWYGGGPAIARR